MTTREDALPAAGTRVRSGRSRLATYARLMRVRQWVKNSFVLAGVFFSDQLFERTTLVRSLLAAVAFCFISSAVYVFNDIFDRAADAAHPQKRDRPLPSGQVSVREATTLVVVLVVATGAVLGAVRFDGRVNAMIGAYALANVLYSIRFKHVSLVDVLVIALGFVLRLEAGIYAVGVEPSSWIVLCTGLLSLLLALAKRRSDLVVEQAVNRRSLEGYTLGFIDQALSMMGAATIVVYALFTVSDYAQDRFDAPLLYLTTFPVVLGVLRHLQITIVQGRYASPTDLVLRDRPLQLLIVVWVAMFFVFVYR